MNRPGDETHWGLRNGNRETEGGLPEVEGGEAGRDRQPWERGRLVQTEKKAYFPAAAVQAPGLPAQDGNLISPEALVGTYAPLQLEALERPTQGSGSV
ncbi:hypothetical protein E5288_WYG005144 [Bos mutus]|uniref:Uncharacterized protein n=1 Tax=Bos mutus TaxID=72004 RepID=A0A6B0S300_9CETA|nr:hypothetical protein [Bos mutus]